MAMEILVDWKRIIWKMMTATGQWSFKLTTLISRDMRKLPSMYGSDNMRPIPVS